MDHAGASRGSNGSPFVAAYGVGFSLRSISKSRSKALGPGRVWRDAAECGGHQNPSAKSRAQTQTSIEVQAQIVDEFGPARRFRLDDLCELLRRVTDCLNADFIKAAASFRQR